MLKTVLEIVFFFPQYWICCTNGLWLILVKHILVDFLTFKYSIGCVAVFCYFFLGMTGHTKSNLENMLKHYHPLDDLPKIAYTRSTY